MADTLQREANPPAGLIASPVPQVWDPTANGGAGGWVRVYGAHNSPRAILHGPDGQPISTANRLPVEATLTGSITVTHTSVNVGTTSTQVLAANSNRKYALFINNTQTPIFLNVAGGNAALNAGILLLGRGSAYEMSPALGNLSTAAVTAIHGGSGNQQLLVTQGV